jgi:ParB family chromosome partitioning protein
MANRKALGRGLKALIPDLAEEDQGTTPSQRIESIAIGKITPNPFQPRETFDSEKLQELKNSIAENGVVQPITVRRHNSGFQLIAGERRLRAVRDLGHKIIPAYVLDVESDEQMLELSIVENIHREDLNPIDIAKGYRRLIDECHLTQEQVGQKLGKDRSTITNFLRLLKLPRPIQESVKKGELSMGHARALLTAASNEQKITLWKKIIKNDLSVRKVEQLVKSPQKKKIKKTVPRSFYIEDAENRLRAHLTTKVSIKPKTRGGAIEVDYYSDDDLERLIGLICE